mmetsp:Transcript_9077/g.20650  ORF Transcript_9077/g.20650 Transcript_9077/m.20650 type:complete len:351 (-) Transcript_9077:102-1154(-)
MLQAVDGRQGERAQYPGNVGERLVQTQGLAELVRLDQPCDHRRNGRAEHLEPYGPNNAAGEKEPGFGTQAVAQKAQCAHQATNHDRPSEGQEPKQVFVKEERDNEHDGAYSGQHSAEEGRAGIRVAMEEFPRHEDVPERVEDDAQRGHEHAGEEHEPYAAWQPAGRRRRRPRWRRLRCAGFSAVVQSLGRRHAASAASTAGHTLRQEEEDAKEVDGAHAARGHTRQLDAPDAVQERANDRTHRDPEAEPSHEVGHVRGPLLTRGHVSDVGVGYAHCSTREAIEEACPEDHVVVRGEAKHHSRGRTSQRGEQEDGPPTEAVREAPKDGASDRLPGRGKGVCQRNLRLLAAD